MYKALITGILVVLCSAGLASAASLSATLPCPDGGSIGVQGDYTFPPGTFSFSLTVTDCKKGTTTYNGTATSGGTWVPTSGSTANVSMTGNTTLTVLSSQGQGTQNCAIQFSGTYNLTTEALAGTSSHNCSTTGTASVDAVEVLSGLDIF